MIATVVSIGALAVAVVALVVRIERMRKNDIQHIEERLTELQKDVAAIKKDVEWLKEAI